MLELKFELKDGRRIFLESFLQSKTYAGLLEGRPNEAVNRSVLNSIVEIPKRMWPHDPCVTLAWRLTRSEQISLFRPSFAQASSFLINLSRMLNEQGRSWCSFGFRVKCSRFSRGQNAAWLKDIPWNDLARDFDW
jgi:hypothetical protein